MQLSYVKRYTGSYVDVIKNVTLAHTDSACSRLGIHPSMRQVQVA